MKIAVIAHAHFPIRQPYDGGLEAHTHQMVNELVRQGHDVTMFAKAGSETQSKLVTIFRGSRLKGKNPLYNGGYHYTMKRIALGNFDIIFNNSLNEIPLKQHTSTMPPMITVFHTPPLPKMVAALQRSPLQVNRTYIAVSSFTADQWSKQCAEDIQVVCNGIDFSNWQTYIHKATTPHAAWIGRITSEKGTHLALQTCIAMGLPITIGGSIYDKTYFKKVIQPLLRHPLVTYIGHADRSMVNETYGQASVALITPLWDEPFGLVALEALASGTPVAALGRGGLRSIVTSQVGALAQESTIESLESAIREALTKSRDTCAAYAREKFTLENMVNAYLLQAPSTAVNREAEGLSWVTMP